MQISVHHFWNSPTHHRQREIELGDAGKMGKALSILEKLVENLMDNNQCLCYNMVQKGSDSVGGMSLANAFLCSPRVGKAS